VFRAGAGLFTLADTSGGQGYHYAGSVTPSYFFYNPGANGQPTWTFPQASPPVASSLNPSLIGSYYSYFADPTLKNHPLSQWNAGIEHELPGNWVLHLNYIGSATSGLPLRVDLDQCHPSTQPYNPSCIPFPNFAQIGDYQNLGFSNYEAFNPAVEHRYANGLSFRADYTWAKSLGNTGGENATDFNGGAVTDRFHLRALRGNNPGIRRTRFLLTAVYDLPVGKGKAFLSNSNAVVEGILGGWRLSTVTLVESGPYLTPIISCTESATNENDLGRSQVVCRPDAVANPNISNPRPNAPWWNINAFVPTPANAGRLGDAGVGTLEGPGTVAISGGLSKSFRIRENIRLRVEATFTNLINHPNFAPPGTPDNPGTNVSNPSTFGQIVTTQAAENSGNRVGQLSARIDF
jgi:hypothetical protein